MELQKGFCPRPSEKAGVEKCNDQQRGCD